MASPYQKLSEDLTQVREDVAYIKAHIESQSDIAPDHEKRLRSLERWKYGIPGSVLAALFALVIN